MKIESITFFSYLENVKYIFDTNLDMTVKLNDRYIHSLIVSSQKKLLILMNN